MNDFSLAWSRIVLGSVGAVTILLLITFSLRHTQWRSSLPALCVGVGVMGAPFASSTQETMLLVGLAMLPIVGWLIPKN